MANQVTNSESRDTAKAMANEVRLLMDNVIQLAGSSPASVTPLAWGRLLVRLESVRMSAIHTLDFLAQSGVEDVSGRREKKRRK